MDAARIVERLGELEASVGTPLTVVAQTGSTNDDAKAAAAAGAPHGALYVADAQTRGRGRGGKAWHSPPGQNVYMSLLLRPRLTPERLAPLSLSAGVAVARVVDAALAVPRAMIKWPNDIYLDAHKVAGILVESIPGAVVIGVGLNVSSRSFPADFAVPPISLDVAGAREIERERLCARLAVTIAALADHYVDAGLSTLMEELAERDFLRGREVRVDGIEGRADGIESDGRLAVMAHGGRHAIASGEVSWR